MRDVVIATCVLKMEFMSTFLNVMAHLPVHLVEQLFGCGPVYWMWMYLTEQYMKTLQNYVRTTAHPEGSMAERYRLEYTLSFCTKYMQRHNATTHRVWDPNKYFIMNDEILRLNEHSKRRMSDEVRGYAHAFDIDNAPCLDPWR